VVNDEVHTIATTIKYFKPEGFECMRGDTRPKKLDHMQATAELSIDTKKITKDYN
jgi:hypothetical protein